MFLLYVGGQGKAGTDLGPHMILKDEYKLIEQIKDMGYSVQFDGHERFNNLRPESNQDPDIGKLKNPRYVSNVTRVLSKAVEGYCQQGSFPLVLGGDHSLAIGTISGALAKYPDACVIWVDAHADVNTPETTDSGNIHGCPVSFLTGIAGKVESFEWVPACLAWDRLAYIGLRDVDTPEKAILREHNVAAFSMHHVDKYGIGKVVEMALERVNPGLKRPIYLSFDVDAMDPAIAPSTGTPVRGGLSWREAMFICEAVAETGCLIGMDLMEINPALEDEVSVEETISAGCSLVRCALGESLL